jgi:hypothetical protein
MESGKPTEPVHGPTTDTSMVARTRVNRASELSDADVNNIAFGMVERVGPEIKFAMIGVWVGVTLSLVAMFAALKGLIPFSVVRVAIFLPVTAFPYFLWKQNSIQNEEADRLGVSRSLLTRMRRKQFLMGFRPKVMRAALTDAAAVKAGAQMQIDVTRRYIAMARDEIVQQDKQQLSAHSDR